MQYGDIKIVNLLKNKKKSEQYLRQTKYWKKISYLDLTLEENEIIYKENNSLIKDRYEGSLNFDVIIKAYTYKKLLEISPFLIFEKISCPRRSNHFIKLDFFGINNFLIMKNYFDLQLNNCALSTKNNFNSYINNNKIINLCLNNCIFTLDNYQDKKNILFFKENIYKKLYDSDDEDIINNITIEKEIPNLTFIIEHFIIFGITS